MRKTHMDKTQLASLLENFLEGSGGEWDWDDFITATELDDDKLESIRRKCVLLSAEFPPEKSNEYCNEQGRQVLRNYINLLRT